ncbi:MAG TPA: tripartite tricarboxylate transporter substrate binding protein [Burkholderiales bacterium]|nr:tripartite tricarboxylate transporter substrate binding protein [Burkholderiales bacterium]
MGVVLLAAVAVCAHAQPAKEPAYPVKPIRLVVPYFPGGTPDMQGRRLGEKLRERLGQPVIVDNRPGANASIGMGVVAKAPADGYTLVIAPVGPWAVNPHVYKLPYDVLADFAPIIHATSTPGVLVVHPSLPVTSVKELIALARQKPGALNYGSTGVGGFGHMSGELFASMARIKWMHVPHKSIAQALTSVMAGEIEVLFNVASPTIPQIRAAKVRGLATTGARRMEALPELPTIAEAGLRGYENTTWNVIAAPARTPQPIVERLNRELAAILQMPDVQEAARVEGSMIVAGTPEQCREFLKSEYDKFGKLVRAAGIKYE